MEAFIWKQIKKLNVLLQLSVPVKADRASHFQDLVGASSMLMSIETTWIW